MKFVLPFIFIFISSACSTPQKRNPQDSVAIVRSRTDSANAAYQDHSITLKQTDTINVNGYIVYFAKHDSVAMPNLFSDDREREKITENLDNSHEQAKAIEKYLQKKDADYFGANDSTLTLFLENKKTLVFPKWDKAKDVGYNFSCFFEKENYYLIFNQYGEGSGWMLVNRKNGFKKYISGEPWFSPDHKKILCVNSDLYAELSFNGFELLEVTGDTLTTRFRTEVKNWGVERAKWTSDTSAVLETSILQTRPEDDIDKKGYVLVRFKKTD